jgi:hypothetical protein
MANKTSFSLPRERGGQLRALAYHHRKSLSGLVADWIERDLQESGLSHCLPDIGIGIGGEHVTFDAGDLALVFATAKDAWDAAEALQRVATRGGGWIHADREDGGTLSITRVGSGVVIEHMRGTGTTSRRAFAPNVALAVSRQLRGAAAQAQVSQ